MPTVSVDVEQRKSVVSAAVTHISIVTKQHDIVQLLFSLSVNETYERHFTVVVACEMFNGIYFSCNLMTRNNLHGPQKHKVMLKDIPLTGYQT